MKTHSLVRFAAVLAAFVFVTAKVSAEDIENFSTGRTFLYNPQFINLDTNNQEVADTTVSVSMYITVYDNYGWWVATFSVSLLNDNSPLYISTSDSGDGDDSDGVFEYQPTGYEASASYGPIDRGISVSYTPPSWLTSYRIEVQAYLTVQGNHEGTGDITVY